jgi:pimeloyl-ACP methyl ester carboxylesterase
MGAVERPDGATLHFETSGEGPTLLLAPYWSGHPDVFAGLLANLSRDHRIATWDARGTGESTRIGPYDIETDSADLEAVLEHLGGAAGIIGVANGCNAVVHVAARRPDLVDVAFAFGAGPFARSDFTDSEAMIGSDSVIDAFLEMLQRDYRGALRTVLTATNPQMSEEELRERIDVQVSYCPQDAAMTRVREWAEDDPTASAAALGDRLWIFSAPSVAGPWLPPLEERRRIIERTMPDAHLETVGEEYGPVSRPDVIADGVRRAIGVRKT